VSYYRVALDKVKVAAPTDSDGRARRTGRIVVLDMTDEQVKALPKVEKENGGWVAAGDDERKSPPPAAPGAPKSQPDRDTDKR
ncbi:MAG: hypothetical protein KIT16_18715, partial [Rhodospirillaceae bacterium]|nr:hypothetical protein [Rhodospirillaceae bacterium]